MINPRIIPQLETLNNPSSLQNDYDMIGDIEDESSCCISEAQNRQINDLINFDEQMSFLKQLEVTEKSSTNFNNRIQDLDYEDSIFAEKDSKESTEEGMQTNNSNTSLNINESDANALCRCFIDHHYSKFTYPDQDKKLFKKHNHTCSKYEQNSDASFLVQEDNQDYLIKSFKIGLEEATSGDLDVSPKSSLGYTSSTETKTRFDKISQNETEDCLKQQEKTLKRRDLHKRNDVINKATIRLIRKFFRVTYNNESFKNGKVRKAMKLKQFKAIVDIVVNRLLEKSSFSTLQGQDRCKIFEVTGRMIDTSLFSKLQKHYKSEDTEEIKLFITKLNNCCRAYTHYNFSEVVNSKYFNIVVDIFASNGGENYVREKDKNLESLDLICKTLKYYALS